MNIRKVKQLIKIAREYKMYPLVKYYELKIELIRITDELIECKKTKVGTYQDSAEGYFTKY